MGLFAKAKAAAETAAPKSKKIETVWLVGSPPPAPQSTPEENEQIAISVRELVSLKREAKTIETKMNVHKGRVKNFAERNFISDMVALGVPPESPLVIRTEDGAKATFVVQDRSAQYGVKADQREALVGLLGEDLANDQLYEETAFGFSRTVLAVPGVLSVLEKYLEKAVKELTTAKDGGKALLAESQAEGLLDVSTKTAFKPGTLDRLVSICGKDKNRVAQMLAIMGSSATRYILPG